MILHRRNATGVTVSGYRKISVPLQTVAFTSVNAARVFRAAPSRIFHDCSCSETIVICHKVTHGVSARMRQEDDVVAGMCGSGSTRDPVRRVDAMTSCAR